MTIHEKLHAPPLIPCPWTPGHKPDTRAWSSRSTQPHSVYSAAQHAWAGSAHGPVSVGGSGAPHRAVAWWPRQSYDC